MRIGELAQATGTAIETIRFYEREQLLPIPARSDNNYRVYGAAHAERLAFIRYCRSLDMSLAEVRALLQLRERPAQDCGEVNALLDDHIGHVAERIAELRALQRALKALRARCAGPQALDECGILGGLEHAATRGGNGPAAPGGGLDRSTARGAAPPCKRAVPHTH